MSRRADSTVLVNWVFWMVRDILESGYWRISFRYCYIDKKNGRFAVFKRKISGVKRSRYQIIDACMLPYSQRIHINYEAENRALCLFHECLEILFAEWKDRYFVPSRWGLSSRSDPILNLEAATFDKLLDKQKAEIAKYLPKGPC